MNEEICVAQVIVNNRSLQTDRIFDYRIPDDLKLAIKKGMRVMVPFGIGNKKLEAYIMNIKMKKKIQYKIKDILYPIDDNPILSDKQIKMVGWLKRKYLCKYIEAIHCIIPAGIINREKKIISLIDKDWSSKVRENSTIQIGILQCIEAHGGKITLDRLYSGLPSRNISNSLLCLKDNNIIKIDYEISSRVKTKTQQYARINIPKTKLEDILNSLKNAKRQKEIVLFLNQNKECPTRELMELLRVNRTSINSLASKGHIILEDREYKRDPFKNVTFKHYPKVDPNLQQKKVIDEITEYIYDEIPKLVLLHGVTGSGKTEIYLQLMEEIIGKGKQGIILVPEIALTPQTIERFYGRFGDGIATLHSDLSEGERYDEWRRIKEGKVNIAIGARSAIFAPFDRLGMIIIDEEHENTYKSDLDPKYHAAEIANFRMKNEKAIVILGSATPSIETYFESKNKGNSIYTLRKRATVSSLPDVEIIDMRDEINYGNTGFFSRKLLGLVEKNINEKKQTILFLNRRGFSTFISCKKCGYVIKCPNCDISMTHHKDMRNIKCHYCGKSQEEPKFCPSCNNSNIIYDGIGTQKIEDLVEKHFPGAVIARMDLDSTSIKGSHAKILDDFKRGKVDILVGTQMITKGLDFPNVTLVGVVNADTSLNLPDFRASERTFQLITQVAGRAGRGDEKGKVIIQTYNPEHYSIQAAANHDYSAFYKEELPIRKEYSYPPFVRLISISFSGKNLGLVSTASQKIADSIKYILKAKGYNRYDEIVFGPNPGIVPRVNQSYRYQLLLKDIDVPFNFLKFTIKYLLIENRKKFVPNGITINIDMNPLYTMGI